MTNIKFDKCSHCRTEQTQFGTLCGLCASVAGANTRVMADGLEPDDQIEQWALVLTWVFVSAAVGAVIFLTGYFL